MILKSDNSLRCSELNCDTLVFKQKNDMKSLKSHRQKIIMATVSAMDLMGRYSFDLIQGLLEIGKATAKPS